MRVIRLIAILILCLPPAVLHADSPPGGEDDILRPVPFTMYIGPYAGGSWVSSNGTFKTLCDCEYTSGNGFGFQVGGFVDYPLSGDFSLTGTLGIRSMRPSFDKRQRRTEFIQIPPGEGDFTDIDFELETVLQLTLVELGVFARWEMPVQGLYVAAGGELGVVVDDNIRETERIVTEGIVYDLGGNREQVSMDGPLSRYYDDTGYRIAAVGKIGYVIPLTDLVSLAPELSLSVPLTPVVSEYQNWSLTAIQVNVFLRFAI